MFAFDSYFPSSVCLARMESTVQFSQLANSRKLEISYITYGWIFVLVQSPPKNLDSGAYVYPL